VSKERIEKIDSVNVDEVKLDDEGNIDEESREDVQQSEIRRKEVIQLFQHCREPFSQQFRAILDYCRVPYQVVEVAPAMRGSHQEFNTFNVVNREKRRVPLVRVVNRAEIDRNIRDFKIKSIRMVDEFQDDRWIIRRSDLMDVGSPLIFIEKMNGIVNELCPGEANTEKRDDYKRRIQELFDFHDILSKEHHFKYFNKVDTIESFLPWLKTRVSKTKWDRLMKNVRDEELEQFANTFPYLVKANQVPNFWRAFQVCDYLRLFKKLRKWNLHFVDMAHFWSGFYLRCQKRKWLRSAHCTTGPRNTLRREVETFLMSFDRHGSKKFPTFHGGRHPDLVDLLVYGSLNAGKDLDLFKTCKNLPRFTNWFELVKDEIGDTQCVALV
jgi:hypothetical protein